LVAVADVQVRVYGNTVVVTSREAGRNGHMNKSLLLPKRCD